MADQFRYFRIEARELTDALLSGLAELGRGRPGSSPTALLLRHAHTLKGAARVVSATAVADLAHSFEELLGPYRQSAEAVPADALAHLQAVVGAIGSQIAALPDPSGVGQAAQAGPGSPAGVAGPAERSGSDRSGSAGPAAPSSATSELHALEDPPDEPLEESARVWLSEIDDVVDGVGDALTQVRTLLACSAKIAQLRRDLSEPPGKPPGDRPQRIARLDEAAEEIQRLIDGCSERIDRELREVHYVAERLRLVPVESIAQDLQLAARDVATTQGKRVRVEVTGGQIRLDAPVLAAAQVALRQVVRNAVAHGIELPQQRQAAGKPSEGHVVVQVRQAGNLVVFRCDDDGRGIDLAAVREQLALHHVGAGDLDHASDERVLELLMHGGVSTAPVLSEVSGRGIGLDVIRDAAHRLGGRMGISTRPGLGTTIELSASGSLTAQQVLLVDAGEKAALPLWSVRTTRRVSADGISRGASGETLAHDGQNLPFLPLAALLGDAGISSVDQPTWTVLILETASGAAALGVQRLVDTAEIAIRPLPALTPVSPVVAGVWLDVDGHPRLVLDPGEVIAAARRRRALDLTRPPTRAPILVVDDSLTTRMLEQSILHAAGYEVELAASAEEGLRMASSRPYSLVLVDVEMPGMDGFAFVEQTRARAELRHLPCILVTTRSSPQDRQRGLEAGARGHIDKGEFHQGHLLIRISELLAD